jgi:hypothetical protein
MSTVQSTILRQRAQTRNRVVGHDNRSLSTRCLCLASHADVGNTIKGAFMSPMCTGVAVTAALASHGRKLVQFVFASPPLSSALQSSKLRFTMIQRCPGRTMLASRSDMGGRLLASIDAAYSGVRSSNTAVSTLVRSTSTSVSPEVSDRVGRNGATAGDDKQSIVHYSFGIVPSFSGMFVDG